MKKGINAWCFPEEWDADKLFRTAKELGFRGMELNVEEKEGSIFTLDTTEEEVRRVIETASKYGIEIFSISTAMLWKFPLTSENRDTRQEGIDIVEKMLEIASQCLAETVLVVPGLVTEDVSYDTAYKRAIEAIKRLTESAEEKKVTIGIENVWNKFLLSPMEMRGFIEAIDSPLVGVYLDIGNLVHSGYPEQWIHLLSDQLASVHIKDFKGTVGNIDGFVPLLAGDIDWMNVAETLKTNGYSGYIAPEIPPHPHHPEVLLKATSEIMDHFFPFD
ncbi:sugar phosphate isomerase/epimerase family protein [Thalassobacillus sp. B23F22_16]|uniref:sugar phosphate isomerase/epimerase family protein n=1 Tax=Thalassobacillus sp. B23F22_16 TaxID=3459513 RepID=UPI00373EA690